MAITAANWSRRVNITGATPAATLTGFVALITEASLPAEIWSIAKNGGGDIRVCLDQEGATELPIEVVKFDTVAQEAVIWARFPTYSASAKGLWVFYGNSSAITYGVGATYGRNAVWSDFEYVFHFSNGQRTIDSTGNYSIAETGSIVEVLDQIGDGGVTPGYNNSNKLHINGFNGALGASARTHTMWIKMQAGDYGILDYGLNTTGRRYTLRLDSNRLRLEVQGAARVSSNTIADNTYKMLSVKNTGSGTFPSNSTFMINGVEPPSYSDTGSTVLNSDAYAEHQLIFANEKKDTRPTGEHGEQWLRLFATTNDQDVLEYNNQSSPATFWTVSSPENTVGGGVTYAISLDAGSYNYDGDTIDLLASRFIGLGAGGYSYSDNDVDLIANRYMLFIAGSYVFTGQDASLVASRVMQLDSGSYFYAGYNVDLIYTPIGGSTYTISLDAGIYSAAGVDVDLIANRIITLDDESYIYTEYDVNISVSRTLTLNSGDYAYSGEYLTLLVNRFIALDDAIYAYTGEPVVLTYSGEVIALISGYSIQYAKDDVSASYETDGINADYANDYISARFS